MKPQNLNATPFGLRLLRTLQKHGLSTPAKSIAELMGDGVDARAVATGARGLVKRGQITMRFPKGSNVAHYRFVRMTPKGG